MHALKGLALPRASHSGEIEDSHRLQFTHAAAPVLFARTVVTAATQSTSANTPNTHVEQCDACTAHKCTLPSRSRTHPECHVLKEVRSAACALEARASINVHADSGNIACANLQQRPNKIKQTSVGRKNDTTSEKMVKL